MPYIYKITNLVNGKLYIGKTSNSIKERWREHISDSQKERCEKRPLYDAFNKYGIDNFQIEKIEEVENDDIACERENYWIEQLRTYIGFEDCNGYNATLGGDSRRLYDYKELANAYLELGTIAAVIQKYNCDWKTVNLACKENNIEIINKPNKKTIKRISPTGEEKIYSSTIDASHDIPNKEPETARKNISRALNKGSTAYGYKWFYLDE